MTAALALVGLVWGGLVVVVAASGLLRALHPPLIAPLVALGILGPVLVYAVSPVLRAFVRTAGLYPLTVFHVWRIPAALTFLWYGLHGALPPAFWILAGVGDLLAGAFTLRLFFGPVGRSTYLALHLFGFADFVVAVGTGLTLTLLQDPRMAPIRDLPLALIPLFGVGISGASHIVAFHLLWTQRRAA